ncbi:MAG: OmpA family protein [Fulvivirga sp.]
MFRSLTIAFLFTLTATAVSAQDSLIVKSIYFGGGSFYIDDIQLQEMKEFIDAVENLEYYEVVIFSHTDNIGGKEYNEWLSRMRSMSVYQELLNINVPKELMEIKDLGYSNPLYTNRSHGGRRMNRRVDIILSPVVF